MTKKEIYVGNIPHELNSGDLKQLFEEFGPVESANIIMDRETNRSKGFGFVKMQNEEDLDNAIQNLNGREVNGRKLVVNEARPREPKFGGGAAGRGDRNFNSRGKGFGNKNRY